MSDGLQLLVEPLPGHEPVSGATAWDDPRTRAALRWSWKGPAAVLGVGLIATLISASGTSVAVIGVLALLALMLVVPVRLFFWQRDRRHLRSVLRSGQWTLVNVVVLVDMLGRDLSGVESVLARGQRRGGVHLGDKVAAIVDPATGEMRGTWLPFTRTNPWPGPDVRRWAWLVVSPGAKYATIAPLDRSVVVGLRRGPGFAKALHDHAWNVLRAADLPPAPGGRPMGVVQAGVGHALDEPERWPNRPMSVRARVIIVATLAAVTVAAGVSDTRAHRSEIEHRKELMRDGVEATAEVVKYCSGGKMPATMSLLIVDGPYEGFSGTRVVYRGRRRSRGDMVTVFHARHNVEDLIIVGYDRDDRELPGAWALLTIVVAIGLGVSYRRHSAIR